MKPQLPPAIQQRLPIDIVRLIHSFVPPLVRKPPPSDSLHHHLTRIGQTQLDGRVGTYLRQYEDYIRD